MTSPIQVEPARVLVGCIHRPEGIPLEAVRARLESLYGPVLSPSPIWPFDATTYYDSEMGAGLLRLFWSFPAPFPPETLPLAKHACAVLEREFGDAGGKRRVNLDPLYMDRQKIVLASFKGAGQKIYLGNGVWADLALRYHLGRWTPFDWTFPDFRLGRYDAYFDLVRRQYLEERRLAG